MRAEGLGELGGGTHLAGGPSSLVPFTSPALPDALLQPHSTAAAPLCPPARR